MDVQDSRKQLDICPKMLSALEHYLVHIALPNHYLGHIVPSESSNAFTGERNEILQVLQARETGQNERDLASEVAVGNFPVHIANSLKSDMPDSFDEEDLTTIRRLQ